MCPASEGDKVCPGMSVTFDVYFLPNEYKDYEHQLTFITERESFVVPIHAIGARGVLDFPDSLHFSSCPVKYPTTKTLLIRNVGNHCAKFTLYVEKYERGQDYFSVSPEYSNLAVGDTIQVNIKFYPIHTGNYESKLIISYDTGEKVYVSLHGAAHDVNIQLNKKSLQMDNTYVSTITNYKISIFNYSNIIAHFRWTQFATQEEEDQQKILYQLEIWRDEQRQICSYLEHTKSDPLSTGRGSVLCRNFRNKRQEVNNKSMLFEDEVIRFDPLEGELWPNTSIDVTIIFKPYEADHYSRVAFCDISGRQSRLPLHIYGDGLGPKLDLSFEKLDMGQIFVGSENMYELVIWNKGDIDATYCILPNFVDFGPAFQFEPADGKISANDYQAICVTFCSTKFGKINECFHIEVAGTLKTMEVTFIGSVIAPTFHFSVSTLDFGIVSYGFPSERRLSLINTSLVPVSFQLRIPSGGHVPSIHAMGDVDPNKKFPFPLHGLPTPKEFEIHPSSGNIHPHSSIEIVVVLTSNHVRTFEEMLVVDVEKVGRNFLGLPIKARCIVPHIEVATPEIYFGKCCLRYPFQKVILLKNDSNLPATYIVLPQEQPLGSVPSILFRSPQPRGIVAPQSKQEVPIEIQVQRLQEQEETCTIAIFGSDKTRLKVLLRCSGEGPVVHFVPDHLDWGVIPVLTPVSKTLRLSNQSLIPAYFSAFFNHSSSPFTVTPEEGEIPPESCFEVTITACLNDSLHFQKFLQLQFKESDSRRVPVQAEGEGTTIISSPLLLPVLDMGPNFCKRPVRRSFTLTNKGRRHHQLTWTTEGFTWCGAWRKMASGTKDDKKNLKKGKIKAISEGNSGPIFNVCPARFCLKAGQSTHFSVEACVKEPMSVSEVLMCHAILGRSGKKEMIMKVNVSAVFVCPILEFSTTSILFHVEKKRHEKLNVLEQELKFCNVSSLPLSVSMELHYPFSILLPDRSTTDLMELYLPDQESHVLKLCFDPNYKTDLHIRTIDDVLIFSYKEHSHIDKVTLRGEVHFPNLEFEKMEVNFGCILNDTEVTRFIKMKNISPLQVKYRWSFFLDPTQTQVRRVIRPKAPALGTEEQLTLSPNEQELKQKEESEEREMLQVDIDISEDMDLDEMQAPLEISAGNISENADPDGKGLPILVEEEEEKSTDDIPEHVLSKDLEATGSTVSKMSSAEKSESAGGLDHNLQMEQQSLCVLHNQLSLNWTDAKAMWCNPILSGLMSDMAIQQHPLKVEEVFDIMPLYGTLESGQKELVTFTFFGHANVHGEVKAVCEVEGGPNYEVMISGEASLVEFHFELNELDFGKQLYDSVGVKELTLVNSGRVPFTYYALDIQPVKLDTPKPGQPELVPFSGTMDPFSEQKLQVRYLPGIPGPFSKHFSIQVAHFEPYMVHIYGEGVFPRISLDLPRCVEENHGYQSLVREACKNLMPSSSATALENFINVCLSNCGHQHEGLSVSESLQSVDTQYQEIPALPTILDVQMEVERLAIRNFALQKIDTIFQNDCLAKEEEEEKRADSVMESGQSQQSCMVSTVSPGDKSKDASQPPVKKLKPRLPKYLLDFGYVVLGTQREHTVHATNTGWFPVSFRVKRRALSHLGFVVGLDQVHQLPGAPDHETMDFIITFDPHAVNLPMGPVEVTVPIDILQGPVVELCLRAHVTEPCMRLSHDNLDFQEVKCGECRIMVVQIHNHHHVPGAWMAVLDANAMNDGFSPSQMKRKVKVAKKTVAIFDVYPSSGVLQPGCRVNVQVNFTPLEQKFYKETIQFRVAQSTQHMRLVCHGQGLEPCLEFTPSVMEFSSILPFSNGDLATVTISNPCSFPVEMYCLELDYQYLEEEKVLRKLPGYDDLNNILLPQRNPGEKLASPLLDFYRDCKKRLEEEDDAYDQQSVLSGDTDKEVDEPDKMKQLVGGSNSTPATCRVEVTKDLDEATAATTQEAKDTLAASEPMQEPFTPRCGVGQVEESPVMEALASYLGVDLSAEARAASNRCGIAIIIHGSPMSGKTFTAISLAQHYEAAVVTLDGVVMEAITSGTSRAATNIREQCLEAGRQWMEEQRLLEELQNKTDIISDTQIHQPHHEALKVSSGPKTKDKSGGCSRTTVSLVQETRGCSQIPFGSGGGYNIGCRPLSISSSGTEEEHMVSVFLPEDLMVEILVERLQMADCQYGVVFDGLESLFVPNLFTAASCILKALNNRRFIFFCTLRMDYNAYQEQEKKYQEEREKQAKLEEDLERQMVEEMEEDEYEALTMLEKERIDQIRLRLRKQRRKRAQEEKERKEREKEEERRKEEEQKTKKHSKRKCDTKDKKGLEPSDKKESIVTLPKTHHSNPDLMGHTEHDNKKKKHGKNGKKGDPRKASIIDMSVSMTYVEPDPVKDAESLLLKRFKNFDQTLKELCDLLDLWDRSTLQLRRPHGMIDPVEEEPVKKSKGKDRAEKDRLKQAEKEPSGAALGQVPSSVVEGTEGAEGEVEDDSGRVPHIHIDFSELTGPAWQKIMEKGVLPSKQEVLEGMGQGPDGLPIPPPATLSVVPYPHRRKRCLLSAQRGKFAFVEDPNLAEKSSEIEEEKHAEAAKRRQSLRPVSSETSQARAKDHKKSNSKTDTTEAQPPFTPIIRSMDRLSLLRCVVPANGQKTLTIFFSSEEQGHFEQTFHFEIVGTKRQYQVVCKGICSFPTISKEPRIVFPSRKKLLKEKEIVHKKYIYATETFEFGPLLVGKLRERANCSQEKFPDNCEMLHIHNPTGQVADVAFCFLNDIRSSVFYLNPPSLTIKPGETAPLIISANPMAPGRFEDALVCCIHENPEPVMFTVACDAVRPELQLDRKQVQFDRMIIHRKDTKVIFLRNPTMLPVAWRLIGLENLGEDFTVNAESGVLSPLSEFPLYTHFRAVKPVQTSKRMIRLEVMDVEDVLGVVQSEAIQFLAEAYDVSLDMNLSKGPACGVDFGTIHVNEEVKEIITLKNKGKYEIGCHFVVETDDPKHAAVFTFTPNKVSLVALEKPTQVAVECKCPYEVEIVDAPMFKCLIAEPSRSKELIATIPIRTSVKAVYSKFAILPTSDISFGYLVVNTKKTRTLNIQNDGDFEFRFTICRKSDTDRLQQARRMSTLHSGKATKPTGHTGRHGHQIQGKKESSRQDAFGGRLLAGMFTIIPSSAIVTPNNSCNVTIDCIADREGKAAEELIIFISDCDPKVCSSGIPYKLFAEGCLCSINVDNIDSIFEEHYICKNLSQIPTEIEGDGVYGEEERRFDFRNVRIGRKAKARFRISNTSKLPCDVSFTLKQVPHKGAQKTEAFEVEPAKASIAAHGCVFTTVSFTPPTMQAFSIMFEAAIEGISRARTLTFELAGEGTLPRISIIQPTLRNSQDQPLLLFSKVMVGRSQTLPLTFFNDGCLPCKVDMIVRNGEDVFTMQTAEDMQAGANDNGAEVLRRMYTASVILGVGEKASVKVTFQPQAAERSDTFLKLSVADNPYEDCMVELVGEGHEDEITIERVTRITPAELISAFQEPPLVKLDESESNALNFGDCPIDSGRTLIFSMMNHSQTDCFRFSWLNHVLLTFSPQVGHLHPGCTKDIMVTFLAYIPVTCTEREVLGRVVKVTFDRPSSEVVDWDDCVKTVKWTDVQDPSQEKPVRPLKRKVVEMEAEPACTEVVESVRDIQLLLTAVADYTQYTCDTSTIFFKDTYVLQTRFYLVTIENTGAVTLNYRWQIDMEASGRSSITTLEEVEEKTSCSSMTNNKEDIPFTVEPAWGSIAPGKATVFKVSFSPLDVGNYAASMTCSIPNLEVHTSEPVIPLKARSLLPVCHFDLQESDYISAMRQKPAHSGPRAVPYASLLDPSTRVVECHAVGVGVVCLREFNIVNPTNSKYNYEWVCEDNESQKLQPAFKCLYPKGHIDSGCRVKVGFRFVSSHLGTVESFWRFNVASHNISIPFLVVGLTREPLAFFNRAHITFDPLLIGQKEMKTVYMINKENTALDFRFVKSSCHNEGFASSVAVEPMSGQIAANSRIAINLRFVPTQEKEVSFNIVCKIQHRVEPLKLNVKAEGYTVRCKLFCEDSTGKRIQLSARGVNQINFGHVQILEKAIRHLYIYNASKVSLDYWWQLGDCAAVRQGLVKIDMERGVVQSDETKQCTLEYCPSQCVPLKDCQLTLKITEGPTFSVTVLGHGMQPGLQFSFQSYNFGHTFVQCPGEPPPTATLKLTNGDTKDISVFCLYKPTPQLQFNFEACVLKAGESISILFTFRPLQAISYKELVNFKVNGCSQRTVEFLGSGCDVKVEVANSNHKLVALGSCFVGDIIRREIPIINHSSSPITFSLSFFPSSSYLNTVGLLTVNPTGPITLPARSGTVKVDILFKPKARIPPFNEQVFMQYGDLTRPLFAISGTCLGVDVELETNYVAFGTVFLRSQISRTLVMTNQGDINTRFRWDLNSFLPDFSIVPVEGYLTSGMEIAFDLKFHPQKTSADIRYENLRCFLDGGPHHPLMLTLTGSCTDITPMKEVYTFNTVVRGKDTKSIPITNRTLYTWHLTPIIEGSQWSGPTTLTVEHDQTKQYDITYRPLTMTTDSKHNGTIFFPFPDGLGQLFNLVGVAEPPRSSGRVNQEIPCKTEFTQPLSVHNWLPKAQKFQAKIDVIKPERVDPSLKITYKDNIDVPANSYATFKFNVYAYREGQLFLKVTFTHEPSGEYQFYEVLFRLTRPGPVSVIDLPAVVRRNLHHKIQLENPLNCPATLTATCNVPEVVIPSNFVLHAYSKGQFSFDYLPLKVGEVQGRLELQNPELGLFIYDLILRASPAAQEKPVHMRVALGQSHVQPVRFLSYSKQKIEYVCKVDCADFQVDRSVSVSPSSTGSTEVTVEVTFEPSRLGEQRTTLTVCSPVGGDYSFPLLGYGSDPTPQGPILVKTGVSSSIFFRNVFFSTVTYSIQVDNPHFSVQKDSETIRPKKEHRIIVQFDASREFKKPIAGRLVVSCQSPIDKTSQIQWVYYLKGMTVKREDLLQARSSLDGSERR